VNLKSLELPTRRANPNFTFTGSYKKRVHVRGVRESLACATCLYQKTAFKRFDNNFSSFFSVKYTANLSSTHPNSVFLISACCGVRFTKRLLYTSVIILRGHCVTHNTHNLVANLLGDAIMGGFSGGGRQLIGSLQYFPTIQKTSKY